MAAKVLDEIYIKIEIGKIYIKKNVEINVEGRGNNIGYSKFSHKDFEEGIFLGEKDNSEICGKPTPF